MSWDGMLTYEKFPEDAPDFLTPNEKYWEYLDQFIRYCESKQIVVFMFPAYLGYAGQEQGWMKELVANGPEKIHAYGAWVANRFKERTNIVWMLLGDMGEFNDEQRTAEAALIAGLKSVSGQRSTQYTAESFSGQNAVDNKDFGSEMTINGVYTWELKVPVPMLSRVAYAHEPPMPAFLLEEPYDEEGPDGNNYNPNGTQPVRRFQWWGWLSTIGGYIAGNGYVWMFQDPTWRQHLDTQGAKDMGRLNNFISALEWWKLVPSGLGGMKDLVINNQPDSSTAYISAAASPDGELLVAYVPPDFQETSFELDISSINKELRAYWFDPTQGNYDPIKGYRQSQGGTAKFTLPGRNEGGDKDWILLLTKVRPAPSR
jgi:hypothetical protein